MTMELQQGTTQWLDWRNQGIGASDVPVIMGESDFQTPFQLWEIRTKRKPPFEGNWATRRGTEAEPKIRMLYELYQDAEFPPCLAQHAECSFMRASIDGFNKQQNVIAEFKFPSKLKHCEAKNQIVPKTYRTQIQAQLFVTGSVRCDYVSYDGEGIVIVPVSPDKSVMLALLKACDKFWNYYIAKDIPPPLTEKELKRQKEGKVDV